MSKQNAEGRRTEVANSAGAEVAEETRGRDEYRD